MKKIIAMLICAVLAILPTLALCEESFDNPFGIDPGEFPEVSQPPADSGESITLTIDGETVRLVYDASPQYSTVQDGVIQVSFYAYGSDNNTLYELYLSLPETVRPGMVITPEYAAMTNEESSVVLIVSQGSQEVYYFASLMDGSVYPTGSDFSITIDSITDADGGARYAGTLSASLVALDMASGDVTATLNIPETPFSFTLGGVHAPEGGPAATPIPDDLKKV